MWNKELFLANKEITITIDGTYSLVVVKSRFIVLLDTDMTKYSDIMSLFKSVDMLYMI